MVVFTGLLVFFVISFNLRLENSLSSLEVLAELDKIRGALGRGVEPLDNKFFLSLLRE